MKIQFSRKRAMRAILATALALAMAAPVPMERRPHGHERPRRHAVSELLGRRGRRRGELPGCRFHAPQRLGRSDVFRDEYDGQGEPPKRRARAAGGHARERRSGSLGQIGRERRRLHADGERSDARGRSRTTPMSRRSRTRRRATRTSRRTGTTSITTRMPLTISADGRTHCLAAAS